MKLNPFIFNMLILLTLTSLAQTDFPEYNIYKIAKKDAEKNSFRLNQTPEYLIGNNYDLKYYRFKWEVDPAFLHIKGEVTSHFVITENNTSSLQFELSNSLTVDSIKYHNSIVNFTHLNKTIDIQLPNSINQGVFDSLTIWYKGVPGGSGGFSSFTISTHNSTPVMWTLSQPYGSSDWWPCKNILNDKIDSMDIYVTTPQQYVLATNGVKISELQQGNLKTYHWKHRYPIESYLIAIAITNYTIYEEFAQLSTGNLRIQNYVYPENLTSAQALTPKVIPSLQVFDSLFGAYPFYTEQYGHAQFGWGGGMEHQTMSFMGSFNYELIYHELAHMWFGNAVTCGSWADIWLNEGFATYLTGLAIENIEPHYSWLSWKQQTINNSTSAPNGSVYCTDTTDIYRIFSWRLSYNKGAYVVHMLRWLLGDNDFYQAMRNYLFDPNLRYSYAKTPDLIYHIDQVYGQSTQWFFDQWVYGEGFPSYNIIVNNNGNYNYTIKINQTQSHPSVSFFKMPVQIQFSGTKDTTIIFDNQYNGQEFNISLDFSINQITFDPNLWILSKSNTVSMIKEEHVGDYKINIWPNPTEDILKIESLNLVFNSIEIFDIAGRRVKTIDKKAISNSEINISDLNKGTYILKILGDKGFYTTKFIKL